MKPEDVWDVKKQSTESTNIVLDDAHLDAPTWHYLVAWFSFVSIRAISIFVIAKIIYLLFDASDVTFYLIIYLLDGPLLLASIYISHGLIFTRTNMRKVFPWFLLILVGGFGSVNDPEIIQAFIDAGINHSRLEAIFIAGVLFFVFFQYRYFTKLEPTRWVDKIKQGKSL